MSIPKHPIVHQHSCGRGLWSEEPGRTSEIRPMTVRRMTPADYARCDELILEARRKAGEDIERGEMQRMESTKRRGRPPKQAIPREEGVESGLGAPGESASPQQAESVEARPEPPDEFERLARQIAGAVSILADLARAHTLALRCAQDKLNRVRRALDEEEEEV